MKRKLDSVTFSTSPGKPRKLIRTSFNVNQPNVEKAQANRAAAILLRQAKMSAMPLQRASPNDRGFVDLAAAAYPLDTTGTITLIATIAQGASQNQRVGKKAMYNSIQCRGRLVVNSTSTVNDVAWIIVYDRRPTGVLPAITDVLVTASPAAFNNDSNAGRFQIVRRVDATLLGNNLTPSTGRESIDIAEFIKFRRPVVYKTAGTGAIGDIEEGALYAITTGNVAAGNNAAECLVGYRVRFEDV